MDQPLTLATFVASCLEVGAGPHAHIVLGYSSKNHTLAIGVETPTGIVAITEKNIEDLLGTIPLPLKVPSLN